MKYNFKPAESVIESYKKALSVNSSKGVIEAHICECLEPLKKAKRKPKGLDEVIEMLKNKLEL